MRGPRTSRRRRPAAQRTEGLTGNTAKHGGWFTILATVSVIAVAALVMPPALAAPGDLDTSFSGDGIVLSTPEFTDMAIAPDGKVVAITGGSSDSGAQIFRYTEAGVRDPTFGGGDGRVPIPYPREVSGFFWPEDVAVQPDGRILVSGRSRSTPTVMRFRTGGALDSTFSGDGRFFVQRPTDPYTCVGMGSADEVGLDGTGRIYLLNGENLYGECSEEEGGDAYFVPSVFRVSPTGVQDPTYGSGGIASPHCQAGVTFDAFDLEVLPDGRAIVAGNHYDVDPETWNQMDLGECLTMTGPDGEPAGAFGTNGVITSYPWHAIDDVEVGTGGVIYALARPGESSSVVARLGSSGVLEWTRRAGGPVNDMELQGTKVLTMGAPDWTVRRFTATGLIDPTFGGGDGEVTTWFGGTPGTPVDGQVSLSPVRRLVVVGASRHDLTEGAVAAYKLGG